MNATNAAAYASRSRHGWGVWLGRTGLGALMLLWAFPLYWLLNTALKVKADIQSFQPVWFAQAPTFDNFLWVWENLDRGPLQRSCHVVVWSVGLALLFGPVMAYALARFRFRASRDLQFWIITSRMLPPAALIMPYYFLFNRLGLLNTDHGLIMVYTAINLPVTTWIMLAYFKSLPRDVEEAALIDGCSQWGAFWRVVVPATASGIAAAGLITAILTWNEFFIAFIIMSSNITFPVQVSSFLATGMNPEYGNMAAAGLMLSLPPMILVVVFRRYLISGLHAFSGGK